MGSQFALAQMRERGWRTDHVRVVPYGVDTHRFKPRAAPKTGGLLIVLYFGGLKPRKNVGALLGVWEKVAPDFPNARLVIAGGGPLLPAYQSLVRKHRIPNVSFLGYVPEADKPFVYQSADVFVFPSTLEGFGLPVLEAMASGLPVITSTASDFAHWLGSYAIPVNMPKAWGRRLRHLINNSDVRASIGEINREAATRMTWERCVEDTVKVYEEVL